MSGEGSARNSYLGSWVVRQASSTEVPDTTSGFRAYNREAALQIQVVSKFTYTLETIIQAGKLLVAVDHVPVRTNPKTRESRLFPSMPAYIRRNGLSIFRIYSQYEPLRVFWGGAMVMGVAGARPCSSASSSSSSTTGHGTGHMQSLVLGGGAVHRRDAARRARRDRRPARRPAHAVPADVRAGATDRAGARHRAVALRARRPAARAAHRRRSAMPAGEDREALGGVSPAGRRRTPSRCRPATRTTSTAPPIRSYAG